MLVGVRAIQQLLSADFLAYPPPLLSQPIWKYVSSTADGGVDMANNLNDDQATI
jgi:hypothetical protein